MMQSRIWPHIYVGVQHAVIQWEDHHEVKKNAWSTRKKPGFIQATPTPKAETVVVDNYFSGFLYEVGNGVQTFAVAFILSN